jgi:hypothetical protein
MIDNSFSSRMKITRNSLFTKRMTIKTIVPERNHVILAKNLSKNKIVI